VHLRQDLGLAARQQADQRKLRSGGLCIMQTFFLSVKNGT
jgi:hypothetical protein